MSRSATSSDPPPTRRPSRRLAPRPWLAVGASLWLAAGAWAPAAAKTFLTGDEALRLAFPQCTVTRHTVFLTDDERARAGALAGEEIPSAVVYPYVAAGDSSVAGTAYFDTHRVRTLPETILIVLAGDGSVRRVEVLAFEEPDSYLARGPWLAQFEGRELDDALSLKRDIRPLSGATLTARATLAAVRRVLAVHAVIRDRMAGPIPARHPVPAQEPDAGRPETSP
jgi:hypothetical protein